MSSEDSNASESPKAVVKREPTLPVQTSDLALSKSSFAQMFMTFNNKVAPNNPKIIKTPSTPAKSILKNSKPSLKVRESLDLFNPPACSTQIFSDVSTPKLSDTPGVSVKSKKHKKKTYSNESYEEVQPDERKKRKYECIEDKPGPSKSYLDFTNIETPHKRKKRKHAKDESVLDEHLLSTIVEQSLNEDPKVSSPKSASKLCSILDKFEADNNLIKSDDVPHFSKDITSTRYETFLLQTPKAFDAKALIGLELSLTNKVRLKHNGVKYDCKPAPCTDPATFLNDSILNTVHPKATFTIQQHIKHKHVPEVSGTLNNGVAFPEDLKERHPLFGADYERKIALEKCIQQKLKAAIEANKRRIKVEQESIKFQQQEMSKPQQDEEIFKLLYQSTPDLSKKHKKSKKRDIDVSKHNYRNDDLMMSEITEKKKKHKKREPF